MVVNIPCFFQALKKASDFMMNTVSLNGGFVWYYSADLSEQWGETPARKSMIWVQDPGTVGVGNMFLDAYKTTGDPLYLNDQDNVNLLILDVLQEPKHHRSILQLCSADGTLVIFCNGPAF